MLSWIGLALVSCTELETLWAGYGHICAVVARADDKAVADHWGRVCGQTIQGTEKTFRLILKLISPPNSLPGDEGHHRKMLSYEVEQYLCDEVTPNLKNDIAVAKCLASTRQAKGKANEAELKGTIATLMTDLRPDFPISGGKRAALNREQVKAALGWLGKFHGHSLSFLPENLDDFLLPPLQETERRQAKTGKSGNKLWLNGGYTYLATRRTEFRYLTADRSSEWSAAFCDPWRGLKYSVAELVADFLTPRGRAFETYIHGDVKSENLFTTKTGDQVAFFDFQYAGLGLGVCDLAKLFTCSVPEEMLMDESQTSSWRIPMQSGERKLLEQYREVLLDSRPPSKQDFEYGWETFLRHWETALVDWCRFQASWGFWGNTDWLEARVRWILDDAGWQQWLLGQSEGITEG